MKSGEKYYIYGKVVKSSEKWGKVAKSDKKLDKSSEKWEKVVNIGKKWGKWAKSWKK